MEPSSKCRYQQFEREIRKYASAKNIGKVGVALSGGADSVATLVALQKAGINVIAMHCNFHLRGEESNRDQKFVENLCHDLQIELKTKNFDVDDYMKNNPGNSLEMACRTLRHDFFRKIMAEESLDRIVTGHNADDNIETMFLNLLRGSGTSGLKGMVYDNEVIWRPLLHHHRDEILRYLDARNYTFVTDSTNLQSDFRRNFLRNEIIPLLRSRWPGFNKALDSSMRYISDENSIVESAISNALPPIGKPLSTETILNFPAPHLLVRRYISPLKPFTTTASEVLAAINADKPHIRTWNLPNGTLILRNHRLLITLKES